MRHEQGRPGTRSGEAAASVLFCSVALTGVFILLAGAMPGLRLPFHISVDTCGPSAHALLSGDTPVLTPSPAELEVP